MLRKKENYIQKYNKTIQKLLTLMILQKKTQKNNPN